MRGTTCIASSCWIMLRDSIQGLASPTTGSTGSSSRPGCCSRCLSASSCMRVAACHGSCGAYPFVLPPARPCTGSFPISRTHAGHRRGWWMEPVSRRTTYPSRRFRHSEKAGTTTTMPFPHQRDTACILGRSISAGTSFDCWNASGLPGTFRYPATSRHAKGSRPCAQAPST